MEALAAVGLSANILQFTQFACKLLNDTRKIRQSATGDSSERQHIVDICKRLQTFNAQLEPPASLISHRTLNTEVIECAASCQKDCTELLNLLENLHHRQGSSFRTWQSFRAALSEQWKAHEIDDLRARLADRERAMILQLCRDSKYVRLHSY